MTAFQATFSRKWPTKERRAMTPLERFSDYVMPEPMSGCWLWIGSANGAGRQYGSFRVAGRITRAHRYSYEAHKGPIPDGAHVLHRCDNPACVNPDHLFLGSPLDNARDRESKGRGNQPTGLRNGRHTKPERTARGDSHYARKVPGVRAGEKNPRAKLTELDVLEIRTSTLGSHRAAKHYGVSKTTVLKIRAGKLWSHIK